MMVPVWGPAGVRLKKAARESSAPAPLLPRSVNLCASTFLVAIVGFVCSAILIIAKVGLNYFKMLASFFGEACCQAPPHW